LIGDDKPLVEGDFFKAGNLNALTVLDGADEFARFKQAVVRACVDPGIATAYLFNEQIARLHVRTIEISMT